MWWSLTWILAASLVAGASVEVLADGTLALSTGPVRDPTGQTIARFNSIWRQEVPGVWRVVFDKGQPPDAASPPPKP